MLHGLSAVLMNFLSHDRSIDTFPPTWSTASSVVFRSDTTIIAIVGECKCGWQSKLSPRVRWRNWLSRLLSCRVSARAQTHVSSGRSETSALYDECLLIPFANWISAAKFAFLVHLSGVISFKSYGSSIFCISQADM